MASAPSPEPICEVVVTGPRTSMMQRMVETLLRERLVACGQRTDWVQSTFRWEGRLDHEPEERVRLHTRASLFDELVERVEALHPYEVPCVVSIPVQQAAPAYQRWVIEQTRDPRPR